MQAQNQRTSGKKRFQKKWKYALVQKREGMKTSPVSFVECRGLHKVCMHLGDNFVQPLCQRFFLPFLLL